jgi:hypothetical protein
MEPESLLQCSQGPGLLLVPNLSQMNPVHLLPSYFSKIHATVFL